MKTKRVAIIGAGLAGLTAAWRLRERGVVPVVFEKDERVGGRSCSANGDGCILDMGAWAFPLESPVHDFAWELGLADELVDIPATVGRPRDGRLRIGDLHRSISLLGTILAYTELGAIRKLLRATQSLPGRTPDETAGSWAARSFSKVFTEEVLAPLAHLFYLQDLGALSRDCLLETISYLATARLRGFRSGMGTLATFLADGAAVRLGEEVTEIRPVDSGPSKQLELSGDGFSDTVDGLIIAIPLPGVLNLIGELLPPRALEAAAAWSYAPMLVAQLRLRERFERAPLIVFPPRGKSRICSGMTFERVKHHARVESDTELVNMYARPDRVDGLMTMSDEELSRAFSAELRHWLSMDERPVEMVSLCRWRFAAASCDPEAPNRLAVLKQGLDGLSQRFPIWTAGDFLGDSSLSGAVASGEQAALDCVTHLTRLHRKTAQRSRKARHRKK